MALQQACNDDDYDDYHDDGDAGCDFPIHTPLTETAKQEMASYADEDIND